MYSSVNPCIFLYFSWGVLARPLYCVVPLDGRCSYCSSNLQWIYLNLEAPFWSFLGPRVTPILIENRLKKSKKLDRLYIFLFFFRRCIFFLTLYFFRVHSKSPFSDVIFWGSKFHEKSEQGGPKMHKNRLKKGEILDRLYFFWRVQNEYFLVAFGVANGVILASGRFDTGVARERI